MIVPVKAMANKENQRPPSYTPPMISSISPSNKPALSRQRDHSACRRPETPLKVRKTRENLKQLNIFTDIPPPCMHTQHHSEHDTSCTEQPLSSSLVTKFDGLVQEDEYNRTLHTQNGDPNFTMAPQTQSQYTELAMQRQKSVSRRMLSRVKQGIASRSKAVQSIRPAESETSLARRLSGRRKQSRENAERRAQSFEISRNSVDSSTSDHLAFIGTAPSVERSFTGSTVSTAEVLRDVSMIGISHTPPSMQFGNMTIPESSTIINPSPPPTLSPSPQPTPRPPKKDLPPLPNEIPPVLSIPVPCVDLDVVLDCEMLDVHASREVWIAMKATVRSKVTQLNTGGFDETRRPCRTMIHAYSTEDQPDLSAFETQAHCKISTLRLCFKSIEGCRIRDIVGQKSMRDLTFGQQCSLFIRLHVPKIRFKERQQDVDQDSLFTELESMVGTLETEILHVEARYRHAMLPADNVVTVRHVCKLKRPKTESRWSTVNSEDSIVSSCEAQRRLAKYLGAEFPAGEALRLIQQYLNPQTLMEADVSDTLRSLTNEMQQRQTDSHDDTNPSVVVTDIDWNASGPYVQISEQFSTAPSTPATANTPFEPSQPLSGSRHKRLSSSTSFVSSTTLAPPLISAPKTTTALSISATQSMGLSNSHVHDANESQDSARQLWRHIRHSSLSSKQLEELNTPERLQCVEGNDEALKELRRKALANKRSIGAETLKGWKWDEKVLGHDKTGEAPWM